jgi:ABC-type polar amino acid transport system ATPase subunit
MINEVLDVMRDLAKVGMTIVVVTHEMGFAREVANRVVLMDEGRIIEIAPPTEFFYQAPEPAEQGVSPQDPDSFKAANRSNAFRRTP